MARVELADVTSRRESLRTLVALALFAGLDGAGREAVAADAVSGDVSYLGAYSDMKFTAEHADGVRVDLWNQGNRLRGIFSVAAGLIGDTPAGLLEDVRHDPLSGRLEFRAKLSTAMRYLGPGKEVPTRDLFEFSGRLTRTSITGKLRQVDGLESANPPTARRVHLRRLVGDGGRNPAGSIVGGSEWQAWAAELMRRRGPSW